MTLSTITFPAPSLPPKQEGLLSFTSTAAKTVTNVTLGTDALISATPEKRTDMSYRIWRTRVGTALLDYGLTKEAFQFNGCFQHPISWIPSKTTVLPSDAATVWLCSDDPSHNAAVFMPTCDLRICPDCAARQSARLAARYIPKALELSKAGGRDKLRHIVFTTPLHLTQYEPDKIQAEIYRYQKLVRKTLEKVQAKGDEFGRSWKTKGAICSFEFGEDGLLLHFHVIQYGDYLPQNVLSEIWSELTNNDAKVVFVRAMDYSDEESLKKSIIETVKYSVKFWSYDKQSGETKYLEPTIMPHLLRVLKGMRRVKSWGVFYNLPKPQAEKFKCEECHKEMERLGVENWSLWIEHGATKSAIDARKHDSLLHLKLANKSKKSRLYESKSPPNESEKYRQKDLFTHHSRSHYLYEDNF